MSKGEPMGLCSTVLFDFLSITTKSVGENAMCLHSNCSDFVKQPASPTVAVRAKRGASSFSSVFSKFVLVLGFLFMDKMYYFRKIKS